MFYCNFKKKQKNRSNPKKSSHHLSSQPNPPSSLYPMLFPVAFTQFWTFN